ncbi:MAG TPA: transcription antitermination factor NusB [bacterium]|nr:transcription antitermination factor NusB [bacterium]
MKNTTDPRHTSRRIALASIFCWLFNEINTEESMVLSKEVLETESDEFDHDLVNFLVEGVKTHNQEIDKIIEECAPEWPIDKISKVDLVVLRLAIFEVLFGKKIPVKVAIDEAVELAKDFGNETSHKFINGVLGTVVEKYLKESIT